MVPHRKPDPTVTEWIQHRQFFLLSDDAKVPVVGGVPPENLGFVTVQIVVSPTRKPTIRPTLKFYGDVTLAADRIKELVSRTVDCYLEDRHEEVKVCPVPDQEGP